MAECIDRIMCEGRGDNGCVVMITDIDGNEIDVGQQAPGTTIYLHEPSKPGFDFKGWVNESMQPLDLPEDPEGSGIYPVKLNEDICQMTYYATFTEHMYHLTVNPEPTEAGSATGGGDYAAGSSVILTAVENPGYHFSGWRLGSPNGSTLGTTLTYTYTMPMSDVTIYAMFDPDQYTVLGNPSPSGYGTVAGSGTYTYNQRCTLIATPAVGCYFVNWSDGVSTPTRSFNVVGNVTLTANFARNKYTVYTTSPQINGNFVGAGTYDYNDNVSINIVPNTGYHLLSWTMNGTAQPVNGVPMSFNITRDTVVEFEFEHDNCTLTINASPTNGGLVSTNGTFTTNTIVASYPYGGTATFQAAPNNGFQFSAWSDGSTTTNMNLNNITTDSTYTAFFNRPVIPQGTYYIVTDNPDPSDPTLMKGYSSVYVAGSEIVSTSTNSDCESYTAAIGSGFELRAAAFNPSQYEFDHWEIWDGNGYNPPIPPITINTNNPLPTTMPSAERSARSHFKYRTFDLTVNIDSTFILPGDAYATISFTPPNVTAPSIEYPVAINPSGTRYESDWFVNGYTGNSFSPTTNYKYKIIAPETMTMINNNDLACEYLYVWDDTLNDGAGGYKYELLTQVYFLKFNSSIRSYTYQDVPYGTSITVEAKDLRGVSGGSLMLHPISEYGHGGGSINQDWFNNGVDSGVYHGEYYTFTITDNTVILAKNS